MMTIPIYEQLFALGNKDRWVMVEAISRRGITTKEELMADLLLPYERYGADWQRVRRNLKILIDARLVVQDERPAPEAHRYYLNKEGWASVKETLTRLC
jgi:hypothetical protein